MGAFDMMHYSTPILFIVFNRPDTTLKVFECIRKVRPKKLFIACDGPRYPIKNEYALCQQVQAIANAVDWPCEVKTLFRTTNLGCGRGVSAAISWFFEQVEEGVVLEDDCVPSDDFFVFAAAMLELYRLDSSVMSVCGSTLLGKQYAHVPGHYVGNSNGVWGWASWRRAWALYDYEMHRIHEPAALERMRVFFGNDIAFTAVEKMFQLFIDRKMDTWDIQWYFAHLINQAHAICPFQNMISNIGHEGAHDTGVSRLHNREYFPIDRSAITERCYDVTVVRDAQLFHFKFHGTYPHFLTLWHMQKHAFRWYEKTAVAVLGKRPLRVEGYLSAVRWHTKIATRKLKAAIKRSLQGNI
jgi:hypothetical protein